MASRKDQYNGDGHSIIDNRKRCYECYVCSNLEKHHCIHGINRQHADEDGLWVYLCSSCHWKVHNGKDDEARELRFRLMQDAERAYLETHTLGEWRQRYGRNYL